MSHVKAGGTAKNVHNNAGQRLGVKRFGGQKVKAGEVLVRQTGSTKLAGEGTYMSRNFTIHRHLRQNEKIPLFRQKRSSRPR